MSDEEARDLSPEERREYFRIRDQVILGYRRIDSAQAAFIAEEIHRDLPDRFTVASRFEASSRVMTRLTHTFAGQMPDLAHYLKHMDDKLNHMARLFVMDEINVQDRTPEFVTLSGGGISFGVDREYREGELVELRIVLLPSFIGILAVGSVVYCDSLKGTQGTGPWNLAVEYRDIREPDRDLLVKHIMNRETEELRKKRHPEED